MCFISPHCFLPAFLSGLKSEQWFGIWFQCESVVFCSQNRDEAAGSPGLGTLVLTVGADESGLRGCLTEMCNWGVVSRWAQREFRKSKNFQWLSQRIIGTLTWDKALCAATQNTLATPEQCTPNQGFSRSLRVYGKV